MNVSGSYEALEAQSIKLSRERESCVQGVEVDGSWVFSHYNSHDEMNFPLFKARLSKKLFLDTSVMRLRSSLSRLAVSPSTSSALR